MAYRKLWKRLASPNLALALLGLLALAVAAGGTLPQFARLPAAELNDLRLQWPVAAVWLERSGLAGVFSAGWFYALCFALLVNLLAGTAWHVAHVRAWLKGGGAPGFRLAGSAFPPEDLLRQFPSVDSSASGRQADVQRGSAGLWGTPLFHLGIVVIVAGAMLSASERFGAHLELAQGEAFSGQPNKLIADRFSTALDPDFGSLRLERLEAQVAEGKYLRELQAFITVQEKGGAPYEAVLSVNHPLKIGKYTVYLDKNFGYSAAFDRILADGSIRPLLINFKVPRGKWGRGEAIERDEIVMLDNFPISYRMAFTPGEPPSFRLEASRGGRQVFGGTLLPGQAADLGPYRLVFLGSVPWVGLYLTTDRAIQLVFAGFVITLGGFLLHLLVRPRRLHLVRREDGWELSGWAMRDDWRFERQWREWQAEARGRDDSH